MYHFPIKWFSSGLTEPADYKVICWQIFNFIPSWIMTTRQASSQTHFLGCYFLNDICVWLRSFLTTKAHYPYWCLMDWCHILMPTSLIDIWGSASMSSCWWLKTCPGNAFFVWESSRPFFSVPALSMGCAHSTWKEWTPPTGTILSLAGSKAHHGCSSNE